jgi:nucleotide-binding universal stress UspA family protein
MPARYTVRRILVPLDGSEYGERALPWARAIAGDSADLVLLAVVPVASEVRDFRGRTVSSADQIAKGYQAMATEHLEGARARWFPDRENVSLVIAEGDPTEQIIWAANQHEADLVVMSSKGRGAIGRFASGSVADRVVRHAPLPVTVIGPEGEIDSHAGVSRIIAPVDGKPLSMSALPVAAGLSVQTGAPAHVVHVLSPEIDEITPYYQGIQPLPATYNEDLLQSREESGRAIVDQALSDLRSLGATATGDVYTGRAAETLEGILQPGDLLVVASHGRKGLPRWVLGSTALKLIRGGSAPVVVVTREYLEKVGEGQAS